MPKISADMCEVKKHRLGQMRLGAVGAQPALHKKTNIPPHAFNACGLCTIRQQETI